MDKFTLSNNEPFDIVKIQKVLTSPEISDSLKISFLKKNDTEIKSAIKSGMGSEEYSALMKDRPLEKFKPIKNSFTKRGDKVLLAKALGIPVNEINTTIENAYNAITNGGKIELSKDNINLLRSYVYRHGKKEQVVAFLGDQLSKVKDVVQNLYQTLEYNTGGVADYFSRPIHRLDNKTLVNMYKTIDENLNKAKAEGRISEAERLQSSQWALKRIYLIQNNSKLLTAIKTYKKLK